ncbi:MAG TPA: family 78 glycoside hydrolase catalytic domain [Ilumatobacter sp.]|nr:family 78 glycoside hydrolase catalytic domain [Ilumatobacter sp.]
MIVTGLRAEYGEPVLGLGCARPRLSWRTEGANAWTQSSYAIEVHDADTDRSLWASGVVAGPDSVLLAWGGPDLASRQRVRWRVTVTGSDGRSATSDWDEFEVGLLDPAEWSATFVVPDVLAPADPAQPTARLRAEFTAPPDVVRARLYVAALGVYTAELNGAVVGDHVLDPGWSSYPNRVRYATHDVTASVTAGTNALGVTLADGWYGERYGFLGNRRRVYGDELALLAQLELTTTDGRRHVVATGRDGWRSALGPTLTSGIYAGEHHDARLDQPGWSQPGFDARRWEGVRPWAGTPPVLVARTGPPVRRVGEVQPVATTTSPSGRTIVDFGQNLVGWVRLRVHGPAGTEVTVRHAEVLEDGELCTRILRTAAATDRYVLRGDPAGESWEPRFTFHGFRYAEITAGPGELHCEAVTAVVAHTDLARTGWFECSDPVVQQLHDNVVWSMRGNFLDVPTDCPQRDERMGWTGDLAVFAPSATFLYDVGGMLAGWLADLAAEQAPNGHVPLVVPDVIGVPLAVAVWGDAAVVVPWELYWRYGDTGLLARQYPSMRAWTEAVVELAGPDRLWNDGFQLGDWVDPAAPPDQPGEGRTDKYLVAQAAFCRTLALTARAAAALGETVDAERYRGLRAEAAAAFRSAYVQPDGRLTSDAQTAYALAIHDDLLADAEATARAGERLAGLVRAEGTRIGTGFVGTPVVCDALCATGHADVAFDLLAQTECPSWLYPVTAGATTVWERWDSLMPDGQINPGEMTSFNHYALGSVVDWLHRCVAGLGQADPGGRELVVTVAPVGAFTHAAARLRTPYGLASVRWEIDAGQLAVAVTVPPNSFATVHLPGRPAERVGSGNHHWSQP